MKNTIPNRYRADALGNRKPSPIQRIFSRTRFPEDFSCPSCGAHVLKMDTEEGKDNVYIYGISCSQCGWTLPGAHGHRLTSSSSDAILIALDEWMAAFYYLDCHSGIVNDDLLSLYQEPASENMKSPQIPERYLPRKDGRRTISPIGRLLDKTELKSIPCPNCGEHRLGVDVTDPAAFARPFYHVHCSACIWQMPILNLTSAGAVSDFSAWYEAWNLLGCPEDKLHEDLKALLVPDAPKEEKQKPVRRWRYIKDGLPQTEGKYLVAVRHYICGRTEDLIWGDYYVPGEHPLGDYVDAVAKGRAVPYAWIPEQEQRLTPPPFMPDSSFPFSDNQLIRLLVCQAQGLDDYYAECDKMPGTGKECPSNCPFHVSDMSYFSDHAGIEERRLKLMYLAAKRLAELTGDDLEINIPYE